MPTAEEQLDDAYPFGPRLHSSITSSIVIRSLMSQLAAYAKFSAAGSANKETRLFCDPSQRFMALIFDDRLLA
jgi:hypothetical protein